MVNRHITFGMFISWNDAEIVYFDESTHLNFWFKSVKKSLSLYLSAFFSHSYLASSNVQILARDRYVSLPLSGLWKFLFTFPSLEINGCTYSRVEAVNSPFSWKLWISSPDLTPGSENIWNAGLARSYSLTHWFTSNYVTNTNTQLTHSQRNMLAEPST